MANTNRTTVTAPSRKPAANAAQPSKGAKATVGKPGKRKPAASIEDAPADKRKPAQQAPAKRGPKAPAEPTESKAGAKAAHTAAVWRRRAAFGNLTMQEILSLRQGDTITIPDLSGAPETHVVMFGAGSKGPDIYFPSTYCPRIVKNGKRDATASANAAKQLAMLLKACAPVDPTAQQPGDPRLHGDSGAVCIAIMPMEIPAEYAAAPAAGRKRAA